MTEITLEAIKAKQAEVDACIAQFEEQQKTQLLPEEVIVEVTGKKLRLAPKELYAGAILNSEGGILYHVIVLPLTTPDHIDWASAVRNLDVRQKRLPNLREQYLIHANCFYRFPSEFYWSDTSVLYSPGNAYLFNYHTGKRSRTPKCEVYPAIYIRREAPE